MIMAAAFSPAMMAGMLVPAVIGVGKMEVSTTLRARAPMTRQRESTTALLRSGEPSRGGRDDRINQPPRTYGLKLQYTF
jgi:hypothetical protein